jgi:hypothetical protein
MKEKIYNKLIINTIPDIIKSKKVVINNLHNKQTNQCIIYALDIYRSDIRNESIPTKVWM